MPIGRAALEELRLKLQAKQAAVRAEVQREQDEVLQVGAGFMAAGLGGRALLSGCTGSEVRDCIGAVPCHTCD